MQKKSLKNHENLLKFIILWYYNLKYSFFSNNVCVLLEIFILLDFIAKKRNKKYEISRKNTKKLKNFKWKTKRNEIYTKNYVFFKNAYFFIFLSNFIYILQYSAQIKKIKKNYICKKYKLIS